MPFRLPKRLWRGWKVSDMDTTNDKAKHIIHELTCLMINNGEPNFSISVSGDKSTVESEQGQIISERAYIKQISLFVNLEDCEDE